MMRVRYLDALGAGRSQSGFVEGLRARWPGRRRQRVGRVMPMPS